MKKISIPRVVFLILFFIPFFGEAQNTVVSSLEKCAVMKMDSILRVNNPSLPSFEENEAFLQAKIADYKSIYKNKGAKATILTIPIVVHVIHNGDQIGVNENISDAQVFSQIDVLNQDFRRMIGTNGYNSSVFGADVEIQFCLAQLDTAGNPFNGIDRVQRTETNWSNTIDITTILQPATFWNPVQYYNVWVVDFGASGVVGVAQAPDNSGLSGLPTTSGAATTDGIVIGYKYFGSIEIAPNGTYLAPYNLGRNLTHQMGHALGLLHPWNGGCGGVGDYCTDTPETDIGHYGCSTSSGCGTVDMIENYMEYTDDVCMNTFTVEQKIRMRTVLTTSPRRVELLNSTVCGISNQLDVGISNIYAPNDSICDSIIIPVVKLYNFGSDTLFYTDIKFGVDGDSSSVYNWVGTMVSGGFELITLPIISSSFGEHTFQAFTSNSNYIGDINWNNNFTNSVFTLYKCEIGEISNNVFSPNGDGVNEGFVIDIPKLIQNDNSVKIYNRWGDILREFVNYNNNDVIWDGKDKNGKMVSSGTYYYIIEIPSIKYSNSGWVQLIK